MKTLGTVVCIGGLAAAGLALVPPANADSPMPDLDRYTTVNTDDYWVAIPTSGYNGAVSSVQFSTPAGQDCSVVINIRGMWDTATCTGPIPGVDQNTATASYMEAGKFTDSASATGQAKSKLLPAGSKVVFTRSGWTGTCAVDKAMTACVLSFDSGRPDNSTPRTPHGFVLGPENSSTF
ncbi:MAG: hypothetical protein U0R77_11125 [Mycolicibacterium insubricum]|nr:hypothetical protein [Mycobacterium sp.]